MTSTSGSGSASGVAFVGLGNLGGAMCRRLVAVGHRVAAYDVSADALAAAVEAGATGAGSAADAARGASVVCVMVNTDEQAIEVVTGPDGVLAGLAPGAVVVLHSTVAPSTVDRLAAACELLDAGISGGPDRAAAGTLVTVVGGSVEALAVARPTLEAYCSDVIHCGPSGTGMAAKLARNLAQYGIWCALFESMQLAERAGVDLGLYADYVRASGLPENHDVILARDTVDPVTDPDRLTHLRWAVQLGHKDLADAFELATRLGLEVPFAHLADTTYARAMGLDDT
ncbi:MAG TPA: NAD(P)-dependent oxidoreductase [Acidimicrobiales bacterium]|nr:NAD(P)-dependent oxidoreductase [Acidimicrobiales bacterium]